MLECSFVYSVNIYWRFIEHILDAADIELSEIKLVVLDKVSGAYILMGGRGKQINKWATKISESDKCCVKN